MRDGRRLEVAGGTGWSTSAWHLTRGDTSRPADCWDAWLVDPLGLCPVPLDTLPEPPRIVSGPPRRLRGASETVTLEVEALADRLLEPTALGDRLLDLLLGGLGALLHERGLLGSGFLGLGAQAAIVWLPVLLLTGLGLGQRSAARQSRERERREAASR